LPGSSVGRRRKPCVPEAAAPAAGNEHAVALVSEIGNQPRRVGRIDGLFVDEGADRNGQLQVVAIAAGAVGPLPVRASSRVELGMETVTDEGVDMRACEGVNGTAVTAVSPAWPPGG